MNDLSQATGVETTVMLGSKRQGLSRTSFRRDQSVAYLVQGVWIQSALVIILDRSPLRVWWQLTDGGNSGDLMRLLHDDRSKSVLGGNVHCAGLG